MSISDIHYYIRLRFRIDSDAPAKFLKRWLKLKSECENGLNKKIVEEWLKNCKIEIVKTMPYLKRAEGGIGGNNNKMNKQLRFRGMLCIIIIRYSIGEKR